jgi:hypothetical protein
MVAGSSGRAARPDAATCPDPPAHRRAAAGPRWSLPHRGQSVHVARSRTREEGHEEEVVKEVAGMWLSRIAQLNQRTCPPGRMSALGGTCSLKEDSGFDPDDPASVTLLSARLIRRTPPGNP